jgi:hypothetical protein
MGELVWIRCSAREVHAAGSRIQPAGGVGHSRGWAISLIISLTGASHTALVASLSGEPCLEVLLSYPSPVTRILRQRQVAMAAMQRPSRKPRLW